VGWRVAQVLCALALAAGPLRAVPGDADNSQDYPGFPRQPGFLITDYAEDNPAEADFPVSHPLPLDANHVEQIHVRGHRFIVRYQLSHGNSPTVYQTQLYYEKLAAAAGFQVAKSGAVGDVTETFCRVMADHDIWVYLEPCNDVNVITVIEAPRGSTPIPAPEQPAAPPPKPPAPVPAPVIKVTSPTPPAGPLNRAVTSPGSATVTSITTSLVPAPKPPPAPAPKSAPPTVVVAQKPAPPSQDATDADGEALYTTLVGQGRVVVPFVFEPNKSELDGSAQPLVERIVAMMKRHPDLFLRIEGHTDNSGDPDDNMRLSAERALAVQDKIAASDIDKKRLDAVGVGGLQPIADNDTAEGREKNRRIELVVWKRYSHREAAPATGAQG
jgi:outer membrane protein OmpA-like peptidoglycan-associated protein